ncbi:MAG: hypothetical protein ACPF9I_07335, partial [Candidatus Thalassarchaeaceae archaeon]
MSTSCVPRSVWTCLRLTEAVEEAPVDLVAEVAVAAEALGSVQAPVKVVRVVAAKIILWTDISGQERPWLTHEEAISLEPILMKTVGYIIHEDDEKIVVCSTMSTDEEHYGNVNAIPRGVILAM